jgi:hypothetical protein
MQSGRLVDAHAVGVMDRAGTPVRVALVDSSVDRAPVLRGARPAALVQTTKPGRRRSLTSAAAKNAP